MCYNPVESGEILMGNELSSHLKGVGTMGTKVKIVSNAEVRQEQVLGNDAELIGVVIEEVVVSNVEGVHAVGQFSDELDFGTPEQLLKDEQAWREKVASTTPEQLAELEAMFREEERKGTTPLHFLGK
jgi:hypothetical protein